MRLGAVGGGSGPVGSGGLAWVATTTARKSYLRGPEPPSVYGLRASVVAGGPDGRCCGVGPGGTTGWTTGCGEQ